MNIKESTISVNQIPVKVIRKKIKNLHLAVYPPDGWVRVAVPESTDDEAVRLAVISNFSWIKRQIKSFEDQPRQSEREFITGESHFYLGNRYLLDIVHTEKRPFIEIRNKKTMVLNIKADSRLHERKKLLFDWYRQEMKRILPGIINKWEIKSGLQVNSYRIKKMKTKWGSCNPGHKRIWLNLELIKKPINCLEYVVVHEMVHFLEHTHNDQFVSHMDRIMPQWRAIRDNLNRTPLGYDKWIC
ncbi:MAG: SprT family zinc-dependent metalloprotease [Paracoccaceae bacterium]|nr:SprT family zinc-dependent metalloprotease [Paracoccaceae bacterium]MDE2674824.1 SprT family zinc-dependent metalloprotease [Paracoccaceae bacterium]